MAKYFIKVEMERFRALQVLRITNERTKFELYFLSDTLEIQMLNKRFHWNFHRKVLSYAITNQRYYFIIH